MSHVPFVSNLPPLGEFVHMIGTMPMAKEIARTRSSFEGVNKSQHNGKADRHTNIAIRGAHGGGGDSEDGLNRFTGPTQLGHNLFRC